MMPQVLLSLLLLVLVLMLFMLERRMSKFAGVFVLRVM
jgi:hypothetical protein